MSESDDGNQVAADAQEVAIDESIAGARAAVQVQSGDEAERVPSMDRNRRGEGRRVTLARQRGGSYSIWMMSRHLQGFCSEWEVVTNFQLPEGIEQQIRIHIESVGEAREIRPEYSGDAGPPETAVRERDTAELRSEVRRSLAGRSDDDDLIGMYRELSENSRELIAGQIRANHVEQFGAPLVSRAHPALQPLRRETVEEMEIELPDRGESWQDFTLAHLRAEHRRIADVIDAVERIPRG